MSPLNGEPGYFQCLCLLQQTFREPMMNLSSDLGLSHHGHWHPEGWVHSLRLLHEPAKQLECWVIPSVTFAGPVTLAMKEKLTARCWPPFAPSVLAKRSLTGSAPASGQAFPQVCKETLQFCANFLPYHSTILLPL